MTGPVLPDTFLRGHIAHRGLHSSGVPENSLAAFRAAVDLGVAIELDVQPSADGIAMAFHDYDLDRLTPKSGPIDRQSAATLTRVPLLDTDQTVATLAEVLTLVAGRVPLLIEIKDRDGDMGPNVGPLEDAVIADLAEYDGDVAVMSFNPHSVARFRDSAPHLPRGLVTSDFTPEAWPELTAATRNRLRDIPDYDALGCTFVSHQRETLHMARISDLKARGAHILTWTVRSKAQESEARRVADAVTFEGYLP
ncbi:glycerophosphodiester phosphodiesterase family protein [Jannaschia donghaensis]|uniref:Glycerophosphoryl diester phosphodiesterase n=1 Tax=Jannaschia donghaensis TaxID=420998 RepID=A0A0M6YEY0_9RHOB|nr:glycerophosphodiester phosphodiesterase family protein [Jannaschia donghaensis]CTQ48912.1 Glycerophosphoryl diester phosphodiesterase [Jannaschia donghaensis]